VEKTSGLKFRPEFNKNKVEKYHKNVGLDETIGCEKMMMTKQPRACWVIADFAKAVSTPTEY
jgi:hypothetical protein